MSIEFPAKNGTAERRMLSLILIWESTVHKIQGYSVDYVVIYLGSRLFAAYVDLSCRRSLIGIQIEFDYWKIGRASCRERV